MIVMTSSLQLESLPTEILLEVARHLDGASVVALGLVCRRFRDIIFQEPKLWKILFLREWRIEPSLHTTSLQPYLMHQSASRSASLSVVEDTASSSAEAAAAVSPSFSTANANVSSTEGDVDSSLTKAVNWYQLYRFRRLAVRELPTAFRNVDIRDVRSLHELCEVFRKFGEEIFRASCDIVPDCPGVEYIHPSRWFDQYALLRRKLYQVPRDFRSSEALSRAIRLTNEILSQLLIWAPQTMAQHLARHFFLNIRMGIEGMSHVVAAGIFRASQFLQEIKNATPGMRLRRMNLSSDRACMSEQLTGHWRGYYMYGNDTVDAISDWDIMVTPDGQWSATGSDTPGPFISWGQVHFEDRTMNVFKHYPGTTLIWRYEGLVETFGIGGVWGTMEHGGNWILWWDAPLAVTVPTYDALRRPDLEDQPRYSGSREF